MNVQIYLLAILAVLLVLLIIEYIGYNSIFRNLRRKYVEFYPEEQQTGFLNRWRFLAILVSSILFVQLYTLNFIGTGPATGMKFGFVTGALVSIPRLFSRRGRMAVVWEYEIMTLMVTVTESIVAGIVIGWMFKFL